LGVEVAGGDGTCENAGEREGEEAAGSRHSHRAG
jgi:hypothetical protein